jgi:hypothetical protein
MGDNPCPPTAQDKNLFSPDFPAFGSSQGREGDSYVGYGTIVPLARNSRKPLGRKTSAKSERKEDSANQGWEHVVIAKGGLIQMSDIPKQGGRVGRRTRKLSCGDKTNASRIRKTTACFNCWTKNISVRLS